MNALLASIPSGVYQDMAEAAGTPVNGWGAVVMGACAVGLLVAVLRGWREGQRLRKQASRRL